MNPVIFNSNVGRVFLNDVNDSTQQRKLISRGLAVPFYDFADVVENLVGHLVLDWKFKYNNKIKNLMTLRFPVMHS